MVSTISIRSQYYTPFKDIISSKGTFFQCTSGLNYDPNSMQIFDYLTNEDILKICPDAENVYSCHNFFGEINFGKGEGETETDIGYAFQSYDDLWIEKYQPEMKEGRWLTNSVDSNQIEVVVSENDYDVNVGDTITFTAYNYPDGVTFTAKVVGIFEDNSKVMGINVYDYNEGNNMNFNNLYYPFNHEIENQIAILASYSAINSITADFDLEFETDYVVQPIISNLIITYPDDESDEQIEADKQKILQYGYANTVSLEEMKSNSRDYIMEKANMFIPIIIILILLVIISVISSSSLVARKNLNNYAVYYVCGLQWKNCLLVSLFNSLITIIFSTVIAILFLISIPYTSFADNIRIIWSNYIVISFIALIVIQLFISMLMPTIIIGKNTPKQILTR
jgi:hypothetical protein